MHADRTRIGQQALDLARDLLLVGDVDRARNWLSIAAELDIEEAPWLLDEESEIDDTMAGHPVVAPPSSDAPVGEDILLQAIIRAKALADTTRKDSEARFEEIFASSSVGMAISDLDGMLVRTNRALANMSIADGLAEDNLDVLTDLGIGVVLYEFGNTRGDLACLEDLPMVAVKMSRKVVERVAGAGDSMFAHAIRQLVPLVRESGTSVIVGDLHTRAQFDWWYGAMLRKDVTAG